MKEADHYFFLFMTQHAQYALNYLPYLVHNLDNPTHTNKNKNIYDSDNKFGSSVEGSVEVKSGCFLWYTFIFIGMPTDGSAHQNFLATTAARVSDERVDCAGEQLFTSNLIFLVQNY